MQIYNDFLITAGTQDSMIHTFKLYENKAPKMLKEWTPYEAQITAMEIATEIVNGEEKKCLILGYRDGQVDIYNMSSNIDFRARILVHKEKRQQHNQNMIRDITSAVLTDGNNQKVGVFLVGD